MALAAGRATLLCDKDKFPAQPKGFAGSASRRARHEKFYQLWSKSFHGLAVQEYLQYICCARTCHFGCLVSRVTALPTYSA
jgi:hypothetical protein